MRQMSDKVTPDSETLPQIRADMTVLPPTLVVEHLQVLVQVEWSMFLVGPDEIRDLAEHMGRELAARLVKLYESVHVEAKRRTESPTA